jgi:hypothetical protein
MYFIGSAAFEAFMIRAVGIVLVAVAMAVAAIAAYFYFATRKAHVTVTCLELDRLHSNLGVLNVPQYTLGKVLLLDDASKQVQGLMTLKTIGKDLAEAGAPQDTSIKLDTKLDVQFDANLPEPIEAKVKAAVSNTLSVMLKGVMRNELANPYAFASASTDLKEKVKTLSAFRHVVLVSTIKSADALEIKLSDDAQVKAEGNIIKVGNYEIAATYKCDGLYNVLGKQSGVFYGVASLAYDQSSDTVVPGDPVEIWKFDHFEAIIQ